MAIVSCPNCASNLRVPDGSTATVRCPKCKTLIPPAAPKAAAPKAASRPPAKPAAKPAFEVVEDAVETKTKPAVKPKAPSGTSTPAARRPAPLPPDDDFEVIDEPPARSRRRDEYDDDYDDDRPRSRRGGRGRAGRRRDRGGRGTDAIGPAKAGTLLMSISMWCYLATYVLLLVFVGLSLMGGKIGPGAYKVAGLVGLINWFVGLVGLALCAGGPAREGARGMCITAACVAALHLVLLLLFAAQGGGLFGSLAFGAGDDDKYEIDSKGRIVRVGGTFELSVCSTTEPLLDALIPGLVYSKSGPGGSSEVVLPLAVAVAEVARLALFLLAARAVAAALRDDGAADQAQSAMVLALGALGALVVGVGLIAVIVKETSMNPGETVGKLFAGTLMLAHTCVFVMPALAVNEVRAAAAWRGR